MEDGDGGDGDAQSCDFVDEVLGVLAMLGRRGRREDDEGFKEQLMLVLSQSSSTLAKRWSVRFWRWRRLLLRRVTAGKADGTRMIRRRHRGRCDINIDGS